jgi:N-acetylmuramoyl-L-alanine amidase
MTRRKRRQKQSTTYEAAEGAVPTASRLVVTVSCIAAIVAIIQGMRETPTIANGTVALIPSPMSTTVSSPDSLPPTDPPAAAGVTQPSSATQTPAPFPTPAPSAPRIGIVAGHWNHDTGAMCPDGLMEVDINLDIAKRVVYILQALGYQADLLAEFDPRLQGYDADALVSIHADSCEAFPNADPPASGFKVASVEDSLVPEVEKLLVKCLAQCYSARTEMYFHETSITFDMTRYHTFYEIDDQTPGAIIETGFMYADRTMLTERADLVAQGIVDGLVCFLEDGNGNGNGH